ncbi:MAG: serine hydrolase domain-containing protein [Actinomycetes bacterium]
MWGFPPPKEARVTLSNWQTPPFNQWGFQHVREIVPTARVPRGAGPVAEIGQRLVPLDDIVVNRPDGSDTTVGKVVADTFTDGFLVLQDGALVAESYPSGMRPDTTHLLMSVTKSFVGCVTGILADHGVLDLKAPLTTYVPELGRSGYDGATLRDVLDMRSGIAFSEDYLNPDAEVRVLEQVIAWRPRRHPELPSSMYEYLLTLGKTGEHGGVFSYRSCETDVLGWVCERAAGVRMPDLLAELLWARLGVEHHADITVDPAGAAMHDGGLNTTLRDLGRFGQMLLDRGVGPGGARIVPDWWIGDSYTGDVDSRRAFAESPTDTRLPGGMYRNQFWVPYADRDVLLCLGIHGQMVYIDPASRVVGVKLSSWPAAQDAAMFSDTLLAFGAVAHALRW